MEATNSKDLPKRVTPEKKLAIAKRNLDTATLYYRNALEGCESYREANQLFIEIGGVFSHAKNFFVKINPDKKGEEFKESLLGEKLLKAQEEALLVEKQEEKKFQESAKGKGLWKMQETSHKEYSQAMKEAGLAVSFRPDA